VQLQRMRGHTVHFHTAVCLMRADHSVAMNVTTEVRFRDLPDTTLINYLETEQPYDCAGSAKCEGMGIALLESIRSDDPTALIGLPLIALSAMLRDVGFEIPPSRNNRP
jgi:septum formation protein